MKLVVDFLIRNVLNTSSSFDIFDFFAFESSLVCVPSLPDFFAKKNAKKHQKPVFKTRLSNKLLIHTFHNHIGIAEKCENLGKML